MPAPSSRSQFASGSRRYRAPHAATTVRASADPPSDSAISKPAGAALTRSTSHGVVSRAPKRCAWMAALVVSSAPEIPSGNPR